MDLCIGGVNTEVHVSVDTQQTVTRSSIFNDTTFRSDHEEQSMPCNRFSLPPSKIAGGTLEHRVPLPSDARSLLITHMITVTNEYIRIQLLSAFTNSSFMAA